MAGSILAAVNATDHSRLLCYKRNWVITQLHTWSKRSKLRDLQSQVTTSGDYHNEKTQHVSRQVSTSF